ncbi:galactose kinase [Haematococcus lacustris]
MDAEMVPIHTDGADERFTDLRIAFRKRFGDDPEVFARAPGRVNLIGEHIDYEGYGVLPMAIKQDTVVAIRKGGSQLVVSNLVDDAYPAKTYAADPAQAVDTEAHSWTNYFVCAYKGVYELLHEVQHQPVPEPSGLQVMIHGQVPLGGGLSSSAAFVCACMVGILGVHDISLPKAQVAEFAARAERYIGVTGGGMDQAISMMGMHGVAKLIDFNPVRAADVVLPAGAVFVIGNSLAVSNKAVGAHKRYNLRVVECRLAAAMLARALGKPQEWCRSVVTLRELEPVVEQASGKSGLAACAEAVQQHLTQDLYSHSEVEAALGISLDELYASSREARKAAQGAQEDGGFKLRQRALHVYQEAQRVRDFKAVCDGTQAPEAKMATLGALMDSSHASCAGLYECSCPELEELVATAKAAGALGARLTGAGWGGCTVSLVKESDVDAFMAAVRERYYASRIASGVVSEADMDKMFFASKPSSGAAVLKLGSRA